MNKRKLKKFLIFLLLFSLSFVLLGKLFEWIGIEKMILQNESFNDVVLIIKTLVSSLFSYIMQHLFEINDFFHGIKDNKEHKMPILYLEVKSTSCVRKAFSQDFKNLINVGNGNRFIYVNMIAENHGEDTVKICYLNNQQLKCVPIEPRSTVKFSFIVFREENKKFKKEYNIHIHFVDQNGKKYIIEALLTINEEKQQSTFTIVEKQKEVA